MKIKIICLMTALVMIFSFVGCNKKEQLADEPTSVPPGADGTEKTEKYPIKFTDDSGTEITIESSPLKIASGAPSNTEIIYALGKQDILVGVTTYCNYPNEALTKEKTGDYNGPNVEKVIEMGIDMYITDWIDDSVRQQLDKAGVTTVVIAPSTYEGVYDRITAIGNILDVDEDAAKVVAEIKDKTDIILERIKGKSGKKVFFENWHEPLSTVGPGSFIDEMITMSGGENIAGDMMTSYGEFSTELLLERDPEVYLTADDGFKTIEDIKARTGYSEMTAVEKERIYFLDPDLISRPGPRIVQALEIVARTIHPDTFGDK